MAVAHPLLPVHWLVASLQEAGLPSVLEAMPMQTSRPSSQEQVLASSVVPVMLKAVALPLPLHLLAQRAETLRFHSAFLESQALIQMHQAHQASPFCCAVWG